MLHLAKTLFQRTKAPSKRNLITHTTWWKHQPQKPRLQVVKLLSLPTVTTPKRFVFDKVRNELNQKSEEELLYTRDPLLKYTRDKLHYTNEDKLRYAFWYKKRIEKLRSRTNWFHKIVRLFTDTKRLRMKMASDFIYLRTKVHCEKPEWQVLGLEPTLTTWFNIMVLHLWMIFIRVHSMKDQFGIGIAQEMIDAFWDDLEAGVIIFGQTSNYFIISKTMKNYLKAYYGAVIAYEEGIQKDAVFVDALWRNFFAMQLDPSIVDAQKLAALTVYARRELKTLMGSSDEALAVGTINWGTFNLDLGKLA